MDSALAAAARGRKLPEFSPLLTYC